MGPVSRERNLTEKAVRRSVSQAQGGVWGAAKAASANGERERGQALAP